MGSNTKKNGLSCRAWSDPSEKPWQTLSELRRKRIPSGCSRRVLAERGREQLWQVAASVTGITEGSTGENSIRAAALHTMVEPRSAGAVMSSGGPGSGLLVPLAYRMT